LNDAPAEAAPGPEAPAAAPLPGADENGARAARRARTPVGEQA
jgi:hypothetical protein